MPWLLRWGSGEGEEGKKAMPLWEWMGKPLLPVYKAWGAGRLQGSSGLEIQGILQVGSSVVMQAQQPWLGKTGVYGQE